MRRLYNNLNNVLGIKLPNYSAKTDLELINKLNEFYRVSNELITVLNINQAYMTPKKYNRKPKAKIIVDAI